MNNQFRDKVVLVTGAASGIGRALCIELGRRGAVVVATDINTEGAQEVASSVEAAGGRAVAVRLDVTRIDAAQAILRGVRRNKKIIIFPFHARLLWWINRIHPSLLTPLGRRTVRNYREARRKSDDVEGPS
jgi:NAD(P)-dependent dehydrogenase (short-subunit alcohol dehydrogenase family)